jgi:hypothetical protein
MEGTKRVILEKCPMCRGYLNEGILYTQGRPGLLFLLKLPKMHMFMSGNRLSKEKGCVVLDGIYQLRINHTAIRAYNCPSCKSVICFYGEDKLNA